VRKLRPHDLFSLVTFSERAQVVVPMGPVSQLDKVLTAIDKIEATGYTNLTGGWVLGRAALNSTPKHLNRRLLLLTDGQANVGITSPAIIQNLVSMGRQCQKVRTSTIGFGLDYQEELLAEMAKLSDGQFYNVDKAESLPAIFAEELEGSQSVVSRNVRVQVTPLDFCTDLSQMSDYPSLTSNGVTELSLGDLRSEEERIAVLELNVLQWPFFEGRWSDSMNSELLCKVTVLWDEISEGETKACQHDKVIRISPVQNEADVFINESTIRWVALQKAAQTLKTATAKRDNTKESGEILRTTIRELEAYGLPGKTQDAVEALQDFLDQLNEGFSVKSRKAAHEASAYLGRPSTTRRLATRFGARFTQRLAKELTAQ
jgi:Ca-activated chloride channel family protein